MVRYPVTTLSPLHPSAATEPPYRTCRLDPDHNNYAQAVAVSECYCFSVFYYIFPASINIMHIIKSIIP